MTNAQNEFAYAQRNGFNGTIQEYLLQQYDAYCAVCKRCDATPVPYGDWLKTKEC